MSSDYYKFYWTCAKCNSLNHPSYLLCQSCHYDPFTENRRVAQRTESQPNPSHESVATTPGASAHPTKRFVRIESYRVHLLDQDNLFGKYLLDALCKAGVLFDDSPQWCRSEIKQIQVEHPWQEHTEIEVYESPMAES